MQGKRYLVPILVLLFLFGVPGPGYGYLYTGNQLVEWMREYEKALSGGSADFYKERRFSAYVIGVADTLSLLDYINVAGVSNHQVFAVVARYLNANPEKWHEPAGRLVRNALLEAFPKEHPKKHKKQ